MALTDLLAAILLKTLCSASPGVRHSQSLMADWATAWRLELFHKSLTELRDKAVPLLLDNGCSRINITNKASKLCCSRCLGWSQASSRQSSYFADLCRRRRTLCMRP